MNNWEQELWQIVETVTVEAEQWFQEMSNSWEKLIEDIDDSLIQGIESVLEDWFSPLWDDDFEDIYRQEDIDTSHYYESFRNNSGGENSFSENWISHPFSDEDFLNPKVEPSSQNQPACIGCSHYHGRVYNGTLLVCGMHPYGWDDNQCPDWESNIS